MSWPFARLPDWFAQRIKTKILVSVLLVFIAIYGATLSYVYIHIKKDLLRSAVQDALSTTQILALILYRNYEIETDAREIQTYILAPKKYKSNLLEINVLDRDLTIVSSTNEDKLFETAAGQRYADALDNSSSIRLLSQVPEPFISIVFPVSASLAGDNYVRGVVEIEFSLQDQFEYLASIRLNTLGAGLAIVLGIVAVITLISQSITRPIRGLYRGMEEVNRGDLDIRVPVVSRDEIGYLTTTFNHMVGSIKVSNEKILAMMESSRRFVPGQFLSALGKDDITDVELGDGTLRDMTVLFMDIRGFTNMSERMPADENLAFLNALLKSILPAVENHGGFVDKYMGDAVLALFPERPDSALVAAIDLRQRLANFNRREAAGGRPAIDVGVGINSGELILGTLGSVNRIDTTVIGNIVNIASRLEKLTKDYQIPIILPEAIFLAMDAATRAGTQIQSLGPVQIRGIKQEMRLTGILA